MEIKIGLKTINNKNPVYFIAEIGVNHCGNLDLAKKMVIAAKESGADAVKFQTFSADKLVTPNTPKVKYQQITTSTDQSHYAMIKSLELSRDKHKVLFDFCKKKKLNFYLHPMISNRLNF